jgi:hypothetical protein
MRSIDKDNIAHPVGQLLQKLHNVSLSSNKLLHLQL